MTYQKIVGETRLALMDVDAGEIKEHIALQFNIEGEGHGAFYLEIVNGKIHIEPYEYFDRNAILSLSAESLFKIINGEISVGDACNAGLLRVEYDFEKACILELLAKKRKAEAVPPAEEELTVEEEETAEQPVEAGEPTSEQSVEVEVKAVSSEEETTEQSVEAGTATPVTKEDRTARGEEKEISGQTAEIVLTGEPPKREIPGASVVRKETKPAQKVGKAHSDKGKGIFAGKSGVGKPVRGKKKKKKR